MAIPVVADADVLFGATTRGLLIHLDYQGVIRLHWSALILDEMSRALVRERRKPDLATAKLHEQRMRDVLPTADIPVVDVQAQFPAVADALRSAKDAHVAAAAQALRALKYYADTAVINLVTKNVRDFKVQRLAERGIAVQHADAFLCSLMKTHSAEVAAAFQGLRTSLTSQPSPPALLSRLANDGQVSAAAALLAASASGVLRL